MINFRDTIASIFRIELLFLCLFSTFVLSGCSGTTAGSINVDSTTTTTTPSTSSGSGNFCSATRAQKIKTMTASGVSKYTAYVSVGSSQVAAQ